MGPLWNLGPVSYTLAESEIRNLKELQVFRPSNFSISSPFQMADMSQAGDSQTDYEALVGQVSIVLEFRLVSCQQYIRCALVTPLVCQMIDQMGYDGEWASQGLQPVAEVEAAPDPAPVAAEVL